MSLLSILGKLGAVGAAPFTGGASLAALPIIDGIGQIGGALGAGAAASKAGRLDQAGQQALLDGQNNRTGLDAAKFNMGTGAERLSQVQRGDFAANMKDTAPTGDPRIDKFGGGGLRPSTLGPDSHNAANEMKRQALMALMSGSDHFTPTHSEIPKAGMLEKIGGIAGLAGGLAGAVRPMLGQRPPQPWVENAGASTQLDPRMFPGYSGRG